jgi:hypothetical protein
VPLEQPIAPISLPSSIKGMHIPQHRARAIELAHDVERFLENLARSDGLMRTATSPDNGNIGRPDLAPHQCEFRGAAMHLGNFSHQLVGLIEVLLLMASDTNPNASVHK